MQNTKNEDDNIILLGRRKRSNSSERKSGHCFIQPNQGGKNLKKKNYFTQSSSLLITPMALSKLARDLTDMQAATVAHALQIPNPSKHELIEFIIHLSSNDTSTLGYVKELLSRAKSSHRLFNRPASVNYGAGYASMQPEMPPLTSFPMCDVRFKHCDQEHVIMEKPELLGLYPVDKTYIINNIGDGNHVILQSFDYSVVPATVHWPQSLTIEINGFTTKPIGNTTFTYIDLTDYLPIFHLRITCDVERQGYSFMIRVLKYSTFRQVAEEIKLTKSREDNITQFPPMQVFSPLMCKTMEYPGRSIYCQHFDCFDLKDYMKIAQMMHRWECPICRCSAGFEKLYFSSTAYHYITLMRQAQSSQPSTSQSQTESLSNSPQFNAPIALSPEPFINPENPPPPDHFQNEQDAYDQFNEWN